VDERTVTADTTLDHRSKSRWFRFGTRTLFLAITAVAVILGVTLKRLHGRKAAINAIQDVGGTMGYAVSGPEWLRKTIRDDECFYDPQRVSLGPIAKDNPDLDDKVFASVSDVLTGFRSLLVLDVRRSAITDESAHLLGQLLSVTHLRLSGTRVSDTTIREIRKLPNLQYLWLAQTEVTDQCVDDLCQLSTLTDLDIRDTHISETGVAALKQRLQTCTIRD